MFDLFDRIVNLDIGNRGVSKLYEPARARNSEALCAAAARMLMDLQRSDRVLLITGSLTRPWVSVNIGETDGPVGTAALARAVSYGFNAIPVLITDTSLITPISATLAASGQACVTHEQAKIATGNKRFSSVAVVQGFPLDDAQARREAVRIIDEFSPKVVISVERTGLTPRGTYHNMLGQDYTEGRAKIDYVVHEATARKIPTIGIGDGGNEIGMGGIAEAVHKHVPHGEILCSGVMTDVVLPTGVSNWGCYGILAALAVLTSRPELLHTPAMERRLIEAGFNAGLIDGNTGKCEPTVDGLPLEVHAGIVELLHAAAMRAMGKGLY